MSIAAAAGAAPVDSADVVRVCGLTVSYRARQRPVPAVRGLDLAIGLGESYGLVGESGSGKSTAAMALTRYLPAGTEVSAAELSVAGASVLELDAPALRAFRASALAVVYQEPGLALNPTMPVGEQIAEVYRLHGAGKHGAGKHGAHRAVARASTLAAIERVRLSPPEQIAGRYPHELSGGQQQRIVIAMALASGPKLLILDEPTTGLDSQVENEIMALIDQLRAELGFASLLISHNLPLVAAHCQRIGVLRDGELVEEGPTADVLLAPRHPYTRALIAALPDISAARRSGPRATATPEEPDDSERSRPPSAVSGPQSATADGPLVTVANLTKHYHRKTALRDVSFTIGRGEVLGLVGESGSGKSTLGLALAGLTGYQGTISFHVADRRRGRGRGWGWGRGGKVLPRVQVVFQGADASLNPRRTVRRVLARSIELLGGTQTVEELAGRTGVAEELLDKLPHQLSGGQKQRVAIARAFAGQVPLVICDEPTSALDVSSQARLLDLLTELQERSGVSYLFISHDLAVVRQVSDRIGVLYDGELVELKAADEIFERPEHPYTRSLVDSALSLRRPRR
jgi:peptide/nickel transport system ATP-binding protein